MRTIKMFKALALSLTLVLLSAAAHADCAGRSCSQVYIQMAYVEGDGTSTWIQTSGTQSNLTCTLQSGALLQVENQSAKKELVALLMMAYAQDKPITLRLSDDSPSCKISYAYVVR